jgi:hypothetical protein
MKHKGLFYHHSLYEINGPSLNVPISKGQRLIIIHVSVVSLLLLMTIMTMIMIMLMMMIIIIIIIILSRVLVTATGFGLVIRFINRLQVVTTITSNTVPDLHNSLHYNLVSLFPLVFTIRFLSTDLNTGNITD